MNKRIKKKRQIEQRLKYLEDETNRQDFVIENLIDHINRSDKMIDANYQVMADNAKATNAELKRIEKLIKKPLWKR